jgi:BirA family biotin operon repressor/biotin-[acetyl-CoA-carboxylase] ligase
MTVIERPNDVRAVDVLSIRLGLRAARALERYADWPLRLKWPNDIFVGDRKLAGILVEARWRSSRVDWVAVGIGVNVRPPAGLTNAGALRAGVDRVAVLGELLPAVRAAANARGSLTQEDLREFATRDLAVGRTCVDPASGRVCGINESGELLVDTGAGVRAFRGGSLIFDGAIA